jgi:plasmid stability protein
MADLLIRDIDAELKRQIEERANARQHSLSEEAKSLIRRGLAVRDEPLKLGTALCGLVSPEDRGDDLVFEFPDPMQRPPDFE